MLSAKHLVIFFILACLSGNVLAEPLAKGIKISQDGDILIPLHLIENRQFTEAFGYNFSKRDVVNDLAILRPFKKSKSECVTLDTAEILMGQPVHYYFYDLVTESWQWKSGSVIDLVGLNKDIRQFKFEIEGETKSINHVGWVFNESGSLMGMTSYKATGIHSLLNEPLPGGKVSYILATKADYIYPFVKDLNIFVSDKKDEAREGFQSQIDELFIDVKLDKAPEMEDTFENVKSRIPSGVVYILAETNSGLNHANFANELLNELEARKISEKVSSDLRKEFYTKIIEKYGHSQLSAEQMIRIAAEFTDGYFIKARADVFSGEAEDKIVIQFFHPKSTNPLVELKAVELGNKDPRQAISRLTQKAVAELEKQLKKEKKFVSR